MKTVKVKTCWQGKIALRERYIQDAVKSGEGITILHDGSSMVIPHNEILNRIVCRREYPVKDKFSKAPEYLFYCDWQTTEAQITLL